MAERRLETGKVEFPHPDEALIENLEHVVAPRDETLAPPLERLGIMQTQDLDVRDDEPGPFDDRREL